MPSFNHVATLERMKDAFTPFAILAQAVSDEDVARAKETVARAQSLGPLVNPTRYREALGDGRLERQQALIQLFDETRTKLRALFPEGWPT